MRRHWVQTPLVTMRWTGLADRGAWQWSTLPDGRVQLTVLGLLNGLFTPFGWALTLVTEEGRQHPGTLQLKRRWW